MKQRKNDTTPPSPRKLAKVFLALAIALVVLLAGLFIFHKIKHSADMKFLTEQGYYNPVSVGDYSMNVAKFGNENGRGNIVVLSGMGGTYVEPIAEENLQSKASGTFLYKVAVNLGLGDILLPALLTNNAGLSKDEWRAYCILQQLSIPSDATANEGAMVNRNRNTTWNTLVETDVPKLYISARHGDLSDPESEEANKKELLPYLNKMGNYEIAYLPGSHFIYKTEPEEFRNYVRNYLDSVE